MQQYRHFGLLDAGYEDNDPRRLVLAGLLGSSAAPDAEHPQSLPLIDVGTPRMPGDAAHDFVQQQLMSGEQQLPQHDVQAELDAYRKYSRYLPGASTAKVFGAMPDFRGGAEPGVAQELYNGDYKGALSDLFGLATTLGVGRFVLPKVLPKGRNSPPEKQKR